jgi:serine/threonine-protein kinase HipA
LCSLAHFDYKAAGIYSYENAFEVMRGLRLMHKEIEQLYKRMIFNVVARNQDDHTKNISFLMDKAGKWSLSPAYDVTYSYNPTGIWTHQHQMTINGKRDDFDLNDLIEVGKKAGLKNSKVTVEQTISVISQWEKYAKNAGIAIKQAKALRKAHRLKIE